MDLAGGCGRGCRTGSRVWSLTSLQHRLMKTGGRLVKHARYYWLFLAKGHLNRRLCGLPRGDAGAVLTKTPLWSPERYDRADSKAGAAAKGVPNVTVVRNRCITAMV